MLFNAITDVPFNATNNTDSVFCPQNLHNESDIDKLLNFDPDKFNFSRCNFSDGDGSLWYRLPDWNVAVKSLAIIPVMIVGIFGNLAVIALILRLHALRKSHINLFILNMAIADLLTTLFCPWVALVNNVYQFYELGPFICQMDGFVKMLCLLSSVLSLMTISIDRYIAICYPLRGHMNRKQSGIITTAIWAIAITLASPLCYWRIYKQRQWLDVLETWCPEDQQEVAKYYWLFLMVPLIYFPLIVITIIYTVIIRRLDALSRSLSKVDQVPVKLKHRQILMKMLLTYILTALICWFPLQVLVYYRRFHWQSELLPRWYQDISFLAQLFASANSAINPIVTFRKSFSHLLPQLFMPSVGTGSNRVSPGQALRHQLDLAVIDWNGWDGSPNTTPPNGGLKSLSTNTTQSFTKQIIMKRAPEIYFRDES
ncbi:unnamed protein product [Oppiella nova]|uniref:G-protein coupled receptors family 1 profile domain-containing protein n=1 Tax=Oppiella nova TaxID=334625 RepID=A0A7R9QPR5_9ACAR|nr:unnamed protein product [Oppiella nova]CAG2169855.1 unnamed protein product [Oppiella nova]